jgi:hypothetical protein
MVYRKGRIRIRVRMSVTLLRTHIEISPLDFQQSNIFSIHIFNLYNRIYSVHIFVYFQYIIFTFIMPKHNQNL